MAAMDVSYLSFLYNSINLSLTRVDTLLIFAENVTNELKLPQTVTVLLITVSLPSCSCFKLNAMKEDLEIKKSQQRSESQRVLKSQTVDTRLRFLNNNWLM